MKKRQRLSSGNLLLLELIFAMFFFSFAVTVTVSVLGMAYQMSESAYASNMAVLQSKDVAEIVRACGSESEAGELLAQKGLSPDGRGGYSMLYGQDKYRLSLSLSENEIDGLYTADIVCRKVSSGDQIYELSIDHRMTGGQ